MNRVEVWRRLVGMATLLSLVTFEQLLLLMEHHLGFNLRQPLEPPANLHQLVDNFPLHDATRLEIAQHRLVKFAKLLFVFSRKNGAFLAGQTMGQAILRGSCLAFLGLW